MSNCKTISVCNQKGGVGKTTTTVNLGVGLAMQGKKVLLIDADPQGDLTTCLGWQDTDGLGITLATKLTDVINETMTDPMVGILHHEEGVDLVPANLELSAMEFNLMNAMSRETTLKNYLSQVKNRYDYVIIDCMPSLGMVTLNALSAADSVIIPVQAQYLPAKGMTQLVQTISKVKKYINPDIKIDGMLLTLVDSRTNLAKSTVEALRANFGNQIRMYAKLSGAVYGIYKGETLVDKYVTDENGQFTTKEYVCDTDWTIREITPSEGYLLDKTIHVELIKAVMMQESGGRGLDPMQAAEGSFNTRYPHEPNGIKDPEYSIQCGVQELKAALTSAEVESPIDMEHIKLALQGYNFGNGYISWAKAKYGGYSYANAVEFSTQQAQRLGWDSYGDTQYPAHVLRYYPYGRAFTAGGNQAIVEVALTQVGNQGGQPYWSWYGFDSRVEWCACFVSWCADQCGYIESGLVPKFAGCVDGANWFKSNGKWQNRTYEPKAGDIIFFDWEGDGTTDHVGIVEKCENGTVYTVEGNSGDACKQRQYTVGSNNIYGYGIPAY